MSTVYCAGGMSCCRSYCFQLPLSNVGGECPSCIESVNKEMELYTSYIHRQQEAMSSIVWYSKKVNVQPSWFTCCYSTTIGSKRVFNSQKFDLSPTNWYICSIFLLLTLFAFVVNQQIPVLTNSTVLVLKRQDLKQTIKKKKKIFWDYCSEWLLMGVALIFLLLVCNLTVATGTLSGLVFYTNVVGINCAIFLLVKYTDVFFSLRCMAKSWIWFWDMLLWQNGFLQQNLAPCSLCF